MWSKIFDNLGLKVGALVLALLLWFYTATEKQYEWTFKVPITPSDILTSPSCELGDFPLPQVEVRLQAKGRKLFQLMFSEPLRIQIDATAYRPGELDYSLAPSDVVLPEEQMATVLEVVEPKFLRMRIVARKSTPPSGGDSSQ
jgi:hypothetical protein